MRSIPSLAVECRQCGKKASLDSGVLEAQLGEPLTMGNVGRLYGTLKCRDCGSKKTRINDDAERLLIDPDALTHCRICGSAIPLPRVTAIADTNTCATCATAGSVPPPPRSYPQPPADKRRCPRCGSPTIVRQNNEDQAYFLGCTGFPKCRWTALFKG